MIVSSASSNFSIIVNTRVAPTSIPRPVPPNNLCQTGVATGQQFYRRLNHMPFLAARADDRGHMRGTSPGRQKSQPWQPEWPQCCCPAPSQASSEVVAM